MLKNRYYRIKVQTKSFHLNGHTLGFHPQTRKLETPCRASQTAPQERTAQSLSSQWSHHRNSSTDSKVRGILQNSINHSRSR